MVQVLDGTINDGYGGMLGWFWAACAVTTIALCFVTWAALKERAYSAVMAATGLLYLAILTGSAPTWSPGPSSPVSLAGRGSIRGSFAAHVQR